MNIVRQTQEKRGFFYGLRFAIVIATAFWILLWAGCKITENMETSYGRGKNAALLAVALLDSAKDQNRLAIIADDITAFLADPDRPLSVEIINQYTSGLTEKSGLTQGQIALVTMALSAELQGAGGNHREFLRGVRDILIFLVPPPISQGMENEKAPHPLAPISAEFEAALNAIQSGSIAEATMNLVSFCHRASELILEKPKQTAGWVKGFAPKDGNLYVMIGRIVGTEKDTNHSIPFLLDLCWKQTSDWSGWVDKWGMAVSSDINERVYVDYWCSLPDCGTHDIFRT